VLNNELKQMNPRFKVNKLSIKQIACVSITNLSLDDCKLKIGGLKVGRVQVIKFLGLLVDEILSWSIIILTQ